MSKPRVRKWNMAYYPGATFTHLCGQVWLMDHEGCVSYVTQHPTYNYPQLLSPVIRFKPAELRAIADHMESKR